MIPPFDDPDIVCGQSTLALELLDTLSELSCIYAPIGGGGLCAGISLLTKSLRPEVRVIGVEASGAARARASLDAGRRVSIDRADTVADGARVLTLGDLNWEILQQHIDDVVLVDDDEILSAMELVMTRAKLLVEPTGAMALAAALRQARREAGPVAVVLSGGNIDVSALADTLRKPS